MPGTYVVDTDRTFTAALLMACGPKTKFGTSEQDVSATGERKWQAEVAITFASEYGMRAVSEVIAVTITGGTDPGASIPPGSPVELPGFRVGFSAPERGQGDRIRGGRPWYQATGLRLAHGQRASKETAA